MKQRTRNALLLSLLASLALTTAGCAPAASTYYPMPGISSISSIDLHRAALSWMSHYGYQITLSDPHSGIINGTYYGFTGTAYPGYVQIFPPSNEMRWRFSFPPHGNSFGEYMQRVVAEWTRK